MSKRQQSRPDVQYLEPHQYSATITPITNELIHAPILTAKLKSMKLVANIRATGAMKDYVVAYNAGLQAVLDLIEDEREIDPDVEVDQS